MCYQYIVMNRPKIERKNEPIELSKDARQAPFRVFFGGSFDPPHHGHSTLPRAVAEICSPQAHLIFVPAARSPFKDKAPTSTNHRIQMLKLALADDPRWEIWEQEIQDATLNPGEPSYWADTWQIVRQMHLDGTNAFLIGADQALSMHRWRRYEEFWKDAIVMLRSNPDIEKGSPNDLIQRLSHLNIWSDEELAHWESRTIRVPTVEVSSTSIRASLADPRRRNTPINGLDRGVQDYILEHGLYLSE